MTFNYSEVKDGFKKLGLSDKISSVWATYLESIFSDGLGNKVTNTGRIIFGSIPEQLKKPFQMADGEEFVIIASERKPERDSDGNICDRIYVLGLSKFDPRKGDITVMLRPRVNGESWTILFGLKPDYEHFTF